MHIQVKPHHFLDYIYEMAAFQGQFNPVMATGSQYGYVGTLLAAGKIDSVTFTSGADDACQNCCKLVEGICTDEFTTPEAVAFNKGYTRKYDYNMKMDMDFVQELPEVFSLGQERDLDEVYALLQEKLTPEIILLNWQREKRVELTFQGLEMLIKKRECLKKERAMKIERIVLAKDAPEQASFAAVELRYYLSLMTGKPYQIEETATENAVILEQTDDYGIDGFALIPEGDCLRIRGGKRGILYGTYEFLEMLGCRFFTPECEKVPTVHEIDLNIKEAIVRKPVFEYREHNYRDIVEHPRFAVKSRINGRHSPIPEKLGGHMSYVWFVHSFDRMIPPEIYGKTHPEFFAMKEDGTRPAEPDTCQLCLTNPDLLEEAIKNVRKVLQENPEHKIISLSQNDNYANCQCEKCRASDKEEGSASGTLLKFINGIAERLEPEFPDVIFDTLAYVYGRPAPKVTKPRPNVCVRLCSIEECFAHPFGTCDDESRKVERPDGTKSSFVEDLQEWSQICNRMHIWDYTTCFAHYPSPHPNWHCLQLNMQMFVRNGVKGVYEQANRCKGGGVDLNELRAYIIGKLLWDPDTDVKKHIEEFTDYYYGAGGVYIREYIETLCGKAEKDNIHVGFNDEPVSELFAEEMLDIYDAILKKAEEAVAGDALRMRRVQKAQLAPRYIRLKRKGMFRHIHDAEEINKFYEDWTSYGLTRIDEWVGKQGTLRALLEDEWRGLAYMPHFTSEGPEIL